MGWKEFNKNIHFEVGVGDRVKLWTNQWYGDSPLQLTFQSVYGIASNKEASVASSLEWLGRNGKAGMFILFGDQMIGKWVVWMNFSVLWVQIYLPLRMEIICYGS